VADGPPGDGDATDATEIKAFLIADVRGYTLFTQERGDEAAAKLARKFAETAREGVEARGGSVIELRGDEALAVFGSPRQAIRAAVDLQQRFADETIADPSLPLTVGIGLDAGEAVPVEGGYRGGALNLAARLCGLAGSGEVLVSQEIAHLARQVEGLRYEDRGDVSLKGLTRPVRVIRVSPEGEDPATRLEPFAPRKPPAPTPPLRPRSLLRGRGLVALLVVLALAAAAVAIPLLLSGGEPSLDAFDADSLGLLAPDGRLVDSIDVGDRPQSVAVGHGSVWVTLPARDAVRRIDTKTRSVVDLIDVGREPAGIGISDEGVWVANSADRTVSRIDPDRNSEAEQIEVGNGPTGVAVGFGSVWVVNTVDGTLVRIDPTNSSVAEPLYVGDGPTGVATGDDAVWVTNSAGATVSKVDPDTMTVVQTPGVGNGPGGVVATADGVWVANRLDGTASRIDPGTNAVTAVSTGRAPAGVAATRRAVWVANEYDGTISKVSIDTHSVTTIPVGNAPSGLAADEDGVWVAVRARGPSHRGGTLRVASDGAPDSIDPAAAYDLLPWQALLMTNDGLVSFRKVSGAEGSLLVPDLATSLPSPTNGGTTYTFEVRPDIRYSTGAVVRPEDFRRAIERIYTTYGSNPATDDEFGPIDMYDVIEGAAECRADPTGCDLSTGIETTERAVTFHLSQPDPDFLYKLAMPFAFAVPADTGDAEAIRPLPATGPYAFDRYDPDSGFELVRNRHFREWSLVAQPDGYPDRIVWTFGIPAERGVDEVVDGRLDWYYPGFEGLPNIDQVARANPELVHGYEDFGTTFFISLGTTTQPFDDPRVRQAVNYAIDRSRVVELYGGIDHARPTCQILPPGYPGYEPYCPYSVDHGPGGEWIAPDVAKAQELIDQVGARGAEVEVWGFDAPGVGTTVTEYFTELLESLGFQATHHVFSNIDRYFGRVYAEHPQVALAGWTLDYPSPSNSIGLLFACDADNNSSGLCDAQLDRMIARARHLQSSDPPRARALWADTERRVVDLAPLVGLVNTIGHEVISPRVGNYQHSPQWGLLLDQLWVI
jgi:ABC-type transport system substrate-binding protein/class 3 adenylate cyclase